MRNGIVEPMFAEAFQRFGHAVVEPDAQPLQALLMEGMSHDFPHEDVAQLVPVVSRRIDDGQFDRSPAQLLPVDVRQFHKATISCISPQTALKQRRFGGSPAVRLRRAANWSWSRG